MAKNKIIPLVLFAEDDDEDWILISDVLEEECKARLRYERVKDGIELLARLTDSERPLPHLIMLDLKMPKKDGAEALKDIRNNPGLKHLPVIVLTTSNLETDIFKAYHGGEFLYGQTR